MHKIKLSNSNKEQTFCAPGSWDEMNRQQLLTWCGVLRLQLTASEALDLAAHLFYKIPVALFTSMSPVYRAQLRSTLEYLKTNTMTDNVLGYVKIMFLKYHGPSHKLTNLTIGEWRRTELYYDLWQKSGQTKFLLLLAATLYRPAGNSSGDDVRKRITENSVVKRARFFSWALHPSSLKAIQLFYEGARAYIQRKHPVVYKKNGSISKGSAIQDWEDRILTYSGDKLGNFNETRDTNLYIFLKHMTERVEEYERVKRQR